MKKSFVILIFIFLLKSADYAQLSFTITNLTGGITITCATPGINLIASSNYTGGPVSYTWVGPSSTLTGSNVTITSPGTYTVLALASNTAMSMQQYVVNSNTTIPMSAISPITQSIACGGAAVSVTAVAISPTTNVQHSFISPVGGTVSSIGQIAIYNSLALGTYTHVLVNLINGCTTTKTLQIVGTGFPTFSVSSPQNFTLGCGTMSATSVIINATGPGALTYTLLPPGSGSYVPGPPSTYTVNTPGTWTAVVKDAMSNCESWIPLNIIQNTIAPTVTPIIPTATLSCFIPSVVLQGQDPNLVNNITYQWLSPGSPTGSLTGNSFTVTNTGINTSSVTGNYTLVATNNGNSCKSSQVIAIHQNLYPPKAAISPSISAVSCLTPSVVLSNFSSTGIPPNTFPISQVITGLLWSGPSPQPTLANASSYLAYTPGTYTLVVQDMNNGCTSSTVTTVANNQIPPVIAVNTLVILPCSGAVALPATVAGSPASANTFSWNVPVNANVTGVNTATLTTDAPGYYTLTVTNNSLGCTSQTVITVWACVGINEQVNEFSSLQVFPNPTADKIYFGSDLGGFLVSISITNALGQLIYLNPEADLKEPVDVSPLKAGIYYLKIKSFEGEKTIKVLKK
jgi:hypothetical protein